MGLYKRARMMFIIVTITFHVVLLGIFVATYFVVVRMPGESYLGSKVELNEVETRLRDQIKQDVISLATEIGVRNTDKYDQLLKAEAFITRSFEQAGYQVKRQEYQAHGQTCTNLQVERTGSSKPDEILVIGAHYDTVSPSPGADDNASAVAGLLALARIYADKSPGRTVRFVAFVNEEPPFFQTDRMGSLVYARACQKKKEKLIAALVLEMLGSFSDEPDSQHYPAPFSYFYPSVGNFIAFVGDISSRALVHRVIKAFRQHAKISSDGIAAPAFIPGVGFSDHWSFWQIGVPAVMVTDTAFFRNPHYHKTTDTPDRLDFDRMTLVVSGLAPVIDQLAQPAN